MFTLLLLPAIEKRYELSKGNLRTRRTLQRRCGHWLSIDTRLGFLPNHQRINKRFALRVEDHGVSIRIPWRAVLFLVLLQAETQPNRLRLGAFVRRLPSSRRSIVIGRTKRRLCPRSETWRARTSLRDHRIGVDAPQARRGCVHRPRSSISGRWACGEARKHDGCPSNNGVGGLRVLPIRDGRGVARLPPVIGEQSCLDFTFTSCCAIGRRDVVPSTKGDCVPLAGGRAWRCRCGAIVPNRRTWGTEVRWRRGRALRNDIRRFTSRRGTVSSGE